MDTIQKASALLRQSEGKLRELLAQAAELGEYQHVVWLAEWASQLHELANTPDGESGNGRDRPTHPESAKSRTSTPRTAPSPEQPAEVGTRQKPKKTGQPKKLRKQSSGQIDYPRFVLQDNQIVKIGRSKKGGAYYEHKAQLKTVRLVADALYQSGKTGTRVAVEHLLPLKDDEGTEIPSYQLYLVIAWLRVEGLILQHGRQGYTLVELHHFKEMVENRLSRLSSR